MSGLASRNKGLAGEREFTKLCERYGFTVRQTDPGGDLLILRGRAIVWHGESKWFDRWRVPEWIAQAEADAGELPWLLGMRQTRGSWYGVQPLEAILARESERR